MKILLLSALLSLSLSCHAFIPEASGGTKVGSMLVISGDEEPSSLWLGNDLNSVAKTKVKGGMWDDMEGLAMVSDTSFFGVTSHSLTKKGKRKPEREQLILFSLKGNSIATERSWSLREAILSYLKGKLGSSINYNAASSGTPDEGGLNIEGLAYLGGKLYLGLRAPLTNDKKAIVLEISNLESTPVISNHMTIKLSGNGIRSLEKDGSKLILISGSMDDTDKAFSLHHLAPAGVSFVLSNIDIPGFTDLIRPESLIVENERALIFLQDFQEEQSQDVLVRLER